MENQASPRCPSMDGREPLWFRRRCWKEQGNHGPPDTADLHRTPGRRPAQGPGGEADTGSGPGLRRAGRTPGPDMWAGGCVWSLTREARSSAPLTRGEPVPVTAGALLAGWVFILSQRFRPDDPAVSACSALLHTEVAHSAWWLSPGRCSPGAGKTPEGPDGGSEGSEMEPPCGQRSQLQPFVQQRQQHHLAETSAAPRLSQRYS